MRSHLEELAGVAAGRVRTIGIGAPAPSYLAMVAGATRSLREVVRATTLGGRFPAGGTLAHHLAEAQAAIVGAAYEPSKVEWLVELRDGAERAAIGLEAALDRVAEAIKADDPPASIWNVGRAARLVRTVIQATHHPGGDDARQRYFRRVMLEATAELGQAYNWAAVYAAELDDAVAARDERAADVSPMRLVR